MSTPAKRLGRGISSLISSDFTQEKPFSPLSGPTPNPPAKSKPGPELLLLKPAEVRQNPHQPRKHFDDAALAGLARSLRERGPLQPIVVRRSEPGYELIAGERRLRAAMLAELTEIPAIVRPVSDEEMLELALVENVQRADLNPVERARGYVLLHEKYGLTHEQIASKMGEDRSSVTNLMRLLQLPDPVLGLVESGMLGMGHARALLAIKDSGKQIKLAEKIAREGWSVRKSEASASKINRSGPERDSISDVNPNISDLEQRMSSALGAKVTIREGRRRHTGRLVIEYYSLDDFERITQRLGLSAE